MRFRKIGIAALAAVSALTLAACSASSTNDNSGDQSTDEVTKIRVQNSNAISAEPLYIGAEQGFFEEEGIEIEFVDLADAAGGFAALQAGQLDLAFSPTIGVLQAVRQNLPLVMVAPADGLHPDAVGIPVDEGHLYSSVGLYVSKESGITDYSGLSDASIAVPELKSQPDGSIISVLQEAGHKTDDIEWLTLSFVPALDALRAGTLDAAFLVSPFTLEADAAGLKRVMNPSVDFFPPHSVASAWIATDTWVADNSETVERFQRALTKAAEWSADNVNEAKQHTIDRSGLPLVPEDMPNPYWPTAFDLSAMQQIDQKLVDIGFFESPIDTDELVVGATR